MVKLQMELATQKRLNCLKLAKPGVEAHQEWYKFKKKTLRRLDKFNLCKEEEEEGTKGQPCQQHPRLNLKIQEIQCRLSWLTQRRRQEKRRQKALRVQEAFERHHLDNANCKVCTHGDRPDAQFGFVPDPDFSVMNNVNRCLGKNDVMQLQLQPCDVVCHNIL